MSYRSDFEVAILFGTQFNNTKKSGDGTFIDEKVEAAYQGYKLARIGDNGQLKRFDPTRSLPIGLMNQLNNEAKAREIIRPITADHVRLVLEVVGGSPA